MEPSAGEVFYDSLPPMRIRQIALVARELEPVVADLCAVLGLEVALRDPGVAEFGLHNAVMPVGDTFLEVVSPRARGHERAGRFLERRSGDGGYMVHPARPTTSPAIAAARRRSACASCWEIALSDIATVHLHPRDLGGALVLARSAAPARLVAAGQKYHSALAMERVVLAHAVRLVRGSRSDRGAEARARAQWRRARRSTRRWLEAGSVRLAAAERARDRPARA